MKKIAVVLLIILALPVFSWAGCTETSPGIWEPDTLALSDVQTCVTNATGAADYRDGDVILLPADSATWSSALTINKGIQLVGAGTADDPQTIITRATNSVFVYVNTTQGFRISGINFRASVKNDSGWVYLQDAVGSASGSAGFRIDNNYFQANAATGDDGGRAIYYRVSSLNGQPVGVIDNNKFLRCRILISGSSNHYRNRFWDDAYWFGTGDTIIVEDNVYNWDDPTRINPGATKTFIDGDMNGPSYVARFNDVTNAYILIHQTKSISSDGTDASGTYLSRGGRIWEIYGNTLDLSADYPTGGLVWIAPFHIRAGTGYIFDNTVNNSSRWDSYTLRMDVERVWLGSGDNYCDGTVPCDGPGSGYPCRDQIGRGKDASLYDDWVNPPEQEDYPAYYWGNDVKSTVHDSPGYIEQNRDYYEDDDTHMQSGVWDSRPGTCTNGDGYWATDKGGNWNRTNGTANDGALYVCTSNAWGNRAGTTDTLGTYTAYVPYTYPHPLTSANPIMTSAAIASDGETVTVNFSETVVTTGYDNGDFDLDCASSGSNIALNSISGSGAERSFTAASVISSGDTCTIDYTGGADEIEDADGDDLEAFTDEPVTNNTGGDSVKPTVTGVEVGADGWTVTITFSETVVTTNSDNGDFDIDCTSHDGNPLLSISGSGDTRTFTTGYIVLPSDVCNCDYMGGADEIEDSAGNDLDQFTDTAVTNNAGGTPTVTITSPTSSATYSTNATTIDLSGTATDDVGISGNVTWANAATSGSGNCTGTDTWSVTGIPLDVGDNVITISASDGTDTGTDSITVTRSVATGSRRSITGATSGQPAAGATLGQPVD